MLTKIIEFSVKQKLIIGLFIIFLLGYGSYELTRLPIDAVPDITNNQVQIITSAPALGATDIERLVTFPVEQANSNIPGLIELRSFSRFGLSVVSLVFNDETDVYWARQQVQERLQNVKDQIPKGVGVPSLGPITTGLGEIYQYVVKAKKGYAHKYNDTDLRTIQDWTVRRELLRVEGIADVSSFGGKLKQYEIAIHPDKLNSFGLTIEDVFSAVEKNNQNTGGAYIEKQSSVLFIRTEGLIGSKEDIENISIKITESGTPLFIKDVASVEIGHAIRYGAMTYNGKGEVAGAVVMMVKGGNSSQVIRDVKIKIEEIQKTLPEGVEIEPFLDRTKMVNNSIHTVETNLLEGALIVIFILVLFLGNFRAGLVVASVIPLAMLFAIIMMNLFGVSGNLMSLGALDFGLIIDGAVIIVEATMHQISHSKKFKGVSRFDQNQMDGIVKDSAGKMMNSAVFGQIVILVVYLPIFTLQGIEGKMFKPMAQTVAFALIGAFILSLTYIPMMSALLLSKKVSHKPTISDRMMGKLERFYQHALEKALVHPKKIIGSVLFLFILSIFTMTKLGGEFIPVLEEGDFAVETRVLTGTSLEESLETCLKAEKILLNKFPEVIKVVAKTGSGEIPTDPMPIEASDLMIILKDKKEWTSANNFNDLAEAMKKELEVIPGVTFGFQYPVQMRFNELMTGARQDIVCKIFGENLDTLAFYARKLGNVIQTIDGAEDLYVEPVTGMPQIVIEYKRSIISQYGLSINAINKVVNTAFSGEAAGIVYEGEKRFDLVVRMEKANREDLIDVQNLLIPTPDGSQIPLINLADVTISDGPNQIQRENAKRRIVVGFNARGRDVQILMQELQKKVENKIVFPPSYSAHYGGSFKNLEEAKASLSVAVPLALLLIFFLLYFAFKSIKQGLLIFSAIPLSAIGGIFALAILDIPFSISAGVGFIALFGVAVLNGIVLVAEFNQLKKEGITDLKRIVLMGTKIRMRPVLMTAFVASLGFLPMAMSHGAGAEVQRPLASVVIGGLLLATFLTLFVLPILYVAMSKSSIKKIPLDNSTVIAVLLFFITAPCFSQTPITLKEALDTAVTNNLGLKNEKLMSAYRMQLINTSSVIPQTMVTADYGRLNSYYFDNKFGVSQGLAFPTVYKNTKKVLTEEWKKSETNVALKSVNLKKNVAHVFYNLVHLNEKKQLLLEIDSIYSSYLEIANLRIKVGESNILEKTTIENQRVQIRNQLHQLNTDLEVELLRFQFLLNSRTVFSASTSDLKMPINAQIDKAVAEGHPNLQILNADVQIALSNIKLEQARLHPTILVSLTSGTMFGTGSNNLTYDYSTRFNSAQIGLGIPLFTGQRQNVKASRIAAEIATNNFDVESQNLANQLNIAIKQFEVQKTIVKELEEVALPNGLIIFETAQKQFINGDINYLEWAMLVNQSISIKSDYQDALLRLNESTINLIYLVNDF